MARGDRLRVERLFAGSTVGYMHHGIDIGDGTVVHARPDDFRDPFGGGRVVRTGSEEFAAGGVVCVTVDPPAAFPPDVVAERALEHVGRDGYCPVVDNCEHFATWCATGRRSSRQVEIVLGRVARAATRLVSVASARMAAGAAERIAIRTAFGATVRVGLRGLVPAALAAEAAALAAEWTAHQAGQSAAASRRAGESAGLATSIAALALTGLPGGPAGVIAGAAAGAAAWMGGSAAAAAASGGGSDPGSTAGFSGPFGSPTACPDSRKPAAR